VYLRLGKTALKWTSRFVLMAGFGLSVNAYSEEASTSLSFPKEIPSTLNGENFMEFPDIENRNHVFGQLRLEGMQYFTAIPESPQLSNSELLTARLSLLRERPHYDLAADFSAGTYFVPNQSPFVVHELYAAYKGDAVTTTAGRKKVDWSEMDSRWQLGLWQPHHAIDALRPEDQGLSGLFLNHRTDDFEILGFATPLFIPSMGPDIRQDNGTLKADSRWYRQPSNQVNVNQRVSSISYTLDLPEEKKLTNNAGYAVTSRYGNKERGAWILGSGGYLPVNDLILKRRITQDINTSNVDVVVSPDVTHHAIGSVDLGYTFENKTKISVSYLDERPEERRPDPDWAIQKLAPLQAYSAALDFTTDNILSRSLAFQLSYLRINGGGITDIDADGSKDDILLFDQRMIFTNAASASVEGQIARFFNRPLVTRLKYLYDYDQRGSLMNTEFLYYPTQTVAVILGADILGVQDENYKPSSFLNQYRANDRIYGGMTYVF
jgi:hypothetical protein